MARPSGTTRKIGPTGGGYMTAGGHWVNSFWRIPSAFTGSAGAQARRNRRRDIRKNGYHGCKAWGDAAYSPMQRNEFTKRLEVSR